MKTVLLIATLLLVGCATRQEPLTTLPHYPCLKVEAGKRMVYSCSADEWLNQVILKESIYD